MKIEFKNRNHGFSTPIFLCALCDPSRPFQNQAKQEKIPNAVLTRCEWGKDDYSLKVENLPKAPPQPEQQELI